MTASRLAPIAALGPSLGLFRRFDSGDARADLALIEADARGSASAIEAFGPDQLGLAVVRLYERYAEALPVGPARDRAAVTARDIRAALGPPFDLVRAASDWAPDFVHVDRRTLGFEATRGREEFLRTLRSLDDAISDGEFRIDEVLAVEPDAYLWRVTNLGTDRSTGGKFERVFLVLGVYGADGRASRTEQFDPDCDAEARARFDELAANRG